MDKFDAVRKCFRCGVDISDCDYTYFGQVTISGFFDKLHPAYYNQFHLCRDCHIKLDSAIRKCMFEGFEGIEEYAR